MPRRTKPSWAAAAGVRGAGSLIGLAWALAVFFVPVVAASAATIGSSLSSAPTASVCAFQSLEPETRYCTVGQNQLAGSHTAADGLVAPFDGIVTQWSVVSGERPPGTGKITLALRTMGGPGYLEKGPSVELPPSPSGTRHTFAEGMKVSAGQHIGIKISISNDSTQEAGAPLAFQETGVGIMDRYYYGDAEPMSAGVWWDQDENTELLLAAVVEPDADRDGLGDLSQDCFPNHPGDQELCGRDLRPPTISSQVKARQRFLQSGVVVARVSSDESGTVRAGGKLEIRRPHGVLIFVPPRVRSTITAGSSATLRVKLRPRALRVARKAFAAGQKVQVALRLSATDTAGLVSERRSVVRPPNRR